MPNSCGREFFQFSDCDLSGPTVRLLDAAITANQGDDRNRFGRRKCEIVEDSPIPRLLSLGQLLAGTRLDVPTEFHKIIKAHVTTKPKLFSAYPKPFAGHMLAFGVIIPAGQVLFEVSLRIDEVVLAFRSQHTSYSAISTAILSNFLDNMRPQTGLNKRCENIEIS